MKAVILAGGKGTRLESITDGPKCLVKINGVPLLYRQLEQLAANGFKDILVLTGWKAEQVDQAVAEYQIPGVKVTTCAEKEPLGTAGALKAASRLLSNEFLVVYGDVLFGVNLRKMVRFHEDSDAQATVLVHPNSHPFDSDLVELDKSNRILRVFAAPHKNGLPCRNLALSAISILSKSLLRHIPKDGRYDLNKDILPFLLGAPTDCYAYQSAELVYDIGTPERFKTANELVRKGCLRKKMRKAIALDRDGVINKKNGFVNSPEEFELEPRAAEAIARFREMGYLVVCVTNQGGIELGYNTEETVERIHAKMDNDLAVWGTYLDRTYVCPHYSTPCECRKPKPGMLLKAADDMGIDLEHSWMIGDSDTDIQAGQAVKARTVFIGDGSKATECGANACFDSLGQVADWLTVVGKW